MTSRPPDDDSPDETLDAIKDAMTGAGFEIMSGDELAAFMAEGEKAIAEHDETAKAEGRRLLSEETDRDVIDGWYIEAKTCDTVEKAAAFMTKLTTAYRHDYGTICHAVAAGALAGAYASGARAVTGFQAGAIFWEFSQHWMQWGDEPRRLIDYSNLLYPQYDDKFAQISPKTAEWLKKRAVELIAQNGEHAHPEVIGRWRRIADGWLPSFITIERT